MIVVIDNRKLREMKPEMALCYCMRLTYNIMVDKGNKIQLDMLRVFKAYIENDYNDEGIAIAPEIQELWSRCKSIIDKEARR